MRRDNGIMIIVVTLLAAFLFGACTTADTIGITLEKAGEAYPAEKDHQDYLQEYPDGYTCHRLRKR
jgi:peptide methionine sulfoxide reductase MsrA